MPISHSRRYHIAANPRAALIGMCALTLMSVPGATETVYNFSSEYAQRATYTGQRTIPFEGQFKPGSIVVRTAYKKLYYVLDGGMAIEYGIGVGREGFTWSGSLNITRKAEWPDWRPPAEMIARQPDLPSFMPGGPDNPLGARAMYLGDTLYRIHGTAERSTIGTAVSSGCIRMLNEEVIDLYSRVEVGAEVYVF